MPEIKSALIDATNDAVARDIFGAPTMFVGDEMFFGKEGLADIEYHLSQS
jgi:2-hydroxychromene-2-carboxylate isomerase